MRGDRSAGVYRPADVFPILAPSSSSHSPGRLHYRTGFDDGSHLRQYGLIAEEVAEVDPGLVQLDADGQPAAVRYHFVNAMLLNEVQKQHRRIADQDARLASQVNEMAQLGSLLAEQEKRVSELERQLSSLLDRPAASHD